MANRIDTSGLFAVPVLCLGLCLIAVCLLVPAAEANRRLAVARDQLRQDLAVADAQLAVNGRFLSAAATDPEVAERLAQRQLRQIRTGAAALHLGGGEPTVAPITTAADMLRVTSPAPVPAFEPTAGPLATVAGTPRRQLCGLGGGLFLIAVGLILGAAPSAAGTVVEPSTV